MKTEGMQEVLRVWQLRSVAFASLLLGGACEALGAEVTANSEPTVLAPSDAIPTEQWRRVETSVDRALAYLASQQRTDGTFPALPAVQPAVTSLCVMAFLSCGHLPGMGPYGEQLERSIDYVLSCQANDGMFSLSKLESRHIDKGASHAGVYNHSIAGLMLSETYGVTDPPRADKIRPAIAKAIDFARGIQARKKRLPQDHGGWRYFYQLFNHTPADADLSVTGWHLMFYRSAKNAEFDVPKEFIDDAMGFVHRCYRPAEGTFVYALHGQYDVRHTRGMVGCGILSLAMGGQHRTEQARRAGDWVLRHPFDKYGETFGYRDRFFYSAYYCSQGMFQLGGKYWNEFYPPLVTVLLSCQRPNGSWPPEPACGDRVFGNNYTTALCVLTLTPPFQLIPIYQR